MAKVKNVSRFVCQNCGAPSPKWSGRCAACGEWNTLTEEAPVTIGGVSSTGQKLVSEKISGVTKRQKMARISSGFEALDVVLGGGMVPGSVLLIAGEPGIGKSTLLLQLAANVATKQSVLYVSGEESANQLHLRADRLGVKGPKLDIAISTSADDTATTITSEGYGLVIVDSIQTMGRSEVSSAPGSLSQITNSAQLLSQSAKASGSVLVLVGHVTKEGSIAGPKVLEHLVDVVLECEGDRYGGFKFVRGLKNRYGSIGESAIFEMDDKGMQEVANPSAALLEERQVSDGSVVYAAMEGSRPLLVEVQALVSKTNFGYPKRAASGVELNRLNLLIAMLSQRTKLDLSDTDVYVNVVGGLKVVEPAGDLAVCMAIASAAKGMALNEDAVVFGEVGLSGEVRHVQMSDRRVSEAKKLGFKYAIGPKGGKNSFIKPVKTVREALNTYLTSK